MPRLVERYTDHLEVDYTLQTNQEIRELVRKLPVWMQQEIGDQCDLLEEMAVDAGKPLIFRNTRDERYITERLVNLEDIDFIQQNLEKFGSDNRAGIDRTLHRISAGRNREKKIIGFSIRFGRVMTGVAENLRQYLGTVERPISLLIIGPPAVGKTTLLRDIIRIIGEWQGERLIVVDTSNEVGGYGTFAHPFLGLVRRFQVPDPTVQYQIINEVVANHSPIVVALDEIKYPKDSEVVEENANKVKVIATVHGYTLENVIFSPKYHPVVGYPDSEKQVRNTDSVFDVAIEVHGKGKYYVHEDVNGSIDKILKGMQPDKKRVGRW